MRKVLLILFFGCIHLPLLFSQSGTNLQFERVVLIGSSADTVPLGRVWKVESVLSSSQLAPSLPANNTSQDKTNVLQIRVNNTLISVAAWLENVYASYRGHSAFGNVTSLPIWLPENTTLEISSNAAYISVLEFKVVP